MGPLLIPQAAQQNVGITALAPPARLSARALSVPRSASVRRTREEATPMQAAPAAQAAPTQLYNGILYTLTPRKKGNAVWKDPVGTTASGKLAPAIEAAYQAKLKAQSLRTGAGYGGNFFGDLINTIF